MCIVKVKLLTVKDNTINDFPISGIAIENEKSFFIKISNIIKRFFKFNKIYYYIIY